MTEWWTSEAAPWLWVVGGLALGVLELLVPGAYLIWLGIAAVLTGVVAFALGVGFLSQSVIFVSIALIAVFSARRYFSDGLFNTADPQLNHPTQRLVGANAVVAQDLVNGSGRVKLGDSEWLAKGVDMSAGTAVRVTGSEGTVLLVEPIAAGSVPAET